jgi:hypothetical protein
VNSLLGKVPPKLFSAHAFPQRQEPSLMVQRNSEQKPMNQKLLDWLQLFSNEIATNADFIKPGDDPINRRYRPILKVHAALTSKLDRNLEGSLPNDHLAARRCIAKHINVHVGHRIA